MRRLNESEIFKILERRVQVQKACRACKAHLERLGINENTELTVKQAKVIVAWEIIFLRIKTRMTDITAKKEFSAAIFSKETDDAMDTIKEAIAHGRKNLIAPHLVRAIGVLQAASNLIDPKASSPHVYAAEENDLSVIASTDDAPDGERFAEYLANPIELDKEKRILTRQRFRKWAESIRLLKFNYSDENLNQGAINELLSHMKKAEQERKAQTKTHRLIQRMQQIDEAVLTAARSDIKAKYEIIKNNHEALDLWLEIVKSAYAIANKNVDAFLDKVAADKKRREKIKADVMKGFVSLAMSPFLLNFFVDPALQVASSMVSKFGDLAVELSQASASSSSNNSIMSELQRQFFTFLSIVGHSASTHEHTMRKIDEMRENSPVEYVELMKQFSEYKLNGVAKEMSQAFDQDTHVWNGHSPAEIVAAQRMKLVREEQASCTEDEWDEHRRSGFTTLFENITLDLTRSYKQISNEIFNNINNQYPKKNDVIQLRNIIKHFSFDESSSGPLSFRAENRKALIKAMADQIEIGIIMKYAAIYDPFFGGDINYGDKNAKLINEHNFDPYECSHFGLKPDRQGIAILDHLINKMPEKKSLLEPLKHVGWAEYFHEIWVLTTTPEQSARQKVLNGLIQEYSNADIAEKLKATVFKFAAERNIVLRETIRPTVKHKWVSEQSLRDHAKAKLAPFIEDAEKHKTVTTRQCKLSERIISSHQLIETTPSSLDDKTMQQITDSGRILKV